MGCGNLFMLSHIGKSVLESVVRMDEPPIKQSKLQLNRANLLKRGFGCRSVLGGKIITCASNAHEIALKAIKL